jgi:hypothetical protein
VPALIHDGKKIVDRFLYMRKVEIPFSKYSLIVAKIILYINDNQG